MKILPYCFFLFIVSVQTNFSQSINVMTFNIRLETPGDGEHQWVYRKDKVADILEFYDVDICGMQEVLYSQLMDLKALLPDWSYVGNGRDDGKTGGEFSPIFYRPDKLELVRTNTFWLSTIPENPGKSWDAALNRIVTWAEFRQKSSSKHIYVFNTHFDHIGKQARLESAKLIVEQARIIAGNAPVVLTGDLNTTPKDNPYKILTDFFLDTRSITRSKTFGPESTFNGFTLSEIENMRIDYIFVSQGLKVNKYATLSHTWAGKFASDHHPVLANIKF